MTITELIKDIKNHPLIVYGLLVGTVCLTVIIHNPNNPYIVILSLLLINPVLVIPYILMISII